MRHRQSCPGGQILWSVLAAAAVAIVGLAAGASIGLGSGPGSDSQDSCWGLPHLLGHAGGVVVAVAAAVADGVTAVPSVGAYGCMVGW